MKLNDVSSIGFYPVFERLVAILAERATILMVWLASCLALRRLNHDLRSGTETIDIFVKS
jgi:hypothetical protein